MSRSERFWSVLLKVYGSAIATEFGGQLPCHWEPLLQQLSDDELEAGLRQLCEDPPATPPNVVQFLDIARPRRRRQRTTSSSTSPAPSSSSSGPYRPAGRDVVDRHLRNLRALLEEDSAR